MITYHVTTLDHSAARAYPPLDVFYMSVVFSCHDPLKVLMLLSRFLVAEEAQQLARMWASCVGCSTSAGSFVKRDLENRSSILGLNLLEQQLLLLEEEELIHRYSWTKEVYVNHFTLLSRGEYESMTYFTT